MAVTNKNGSVTITPLEDLQNFGRTLRNLPRTAGEAMAAHSASLAAEQNAILARNGRAAMARQAAMAAAGNRAGPPTGYMYPPVPTVDTRDMDRVALGEAAMGGRTGPMTSRAAPRLDKGVLAAMQNAQMPEVPAPGAGRLDKGVMAAFPMSTMDDAARAAIAARMQPAPARGPFDALGREGDPSLMDRATVAAMLNSRPPMQTMDDAARAAMLVRPAKPDYQNSRGGTITLPEVLRQYLGADFGYAGARGAKTGAVAPTATEAPTPTAPKGPAPKVRAVDAAQQAIDRVTGRTVGYSEYKVGQRKQAAQDQAVENILMSAAMMPRAQFIDYMAAQPTAPKQRSGSDEAIYRLLADYDDNYQREVAAGVPEEQARANRTARIEALKAGWFMPQANGEQ